MWATAILRWRLGDPIQAIQTLVSRDAADTPISGLYERVSGGAAESVSSAPDDVLALTLLNRLAGAHPEVMPGGADVAAGLCGLACRAAHALDVMGVPILALEALQVRCPDHTLAKSASLFPGGFP
jgi:hypothetical protein